MTTFSQIPVNTASTSDFVIGTTSGNTTDSRISISGLASTVATLIPGLAPGGTTGQVQFNNGTVLGGFGTWNSGANHLTINSLNLDSGTGNMTVNSNASYQINAAGVGILDYNINQAGEWNTFSSVNIGPGGSSGSQQLVLNANGSGLVPQIMINAQATNGWFALGPKNTSGVSLWFGQVSNTQTTWDTSTVASHLAHFEVFNGALGLGSGGTVDAYLQRVANVPSVITFSTNSVGLPTAWFNWGGQTRNTSAQNFTTTTTLATVTGLSANVQAGRTYKFEAHLPVTAGGTAGGIKAAIAGTATATNIIYDGWAHSNNVIVGQAQASALGTTVASAVLGAATGHVVIYGTITVNAAGTLLVQAAQNTSSGTTTIGQGATFYVYDNA